MGWTVRIYFLVTFMITNCLAMWPESWIIGNTCAEGAKLNFDNCTAYAAECLCENPNYLASVVQCIQSHVNTTQSIASAWEFVSKKTCHKDALQAETLFNQAQIKLNNSEIIILDAKSNRTAKFVKPVIVDHDSLKNVYRSIYINLHNRDASVWQASALMMLWVAVIGAASLSNLFQYIGYKFASKRQTMARPNGLMRMLQKHLFIPACFGTSHIDRKYLFGIIPMLIPTRMETFVITVYGSAAFLFLTGSYQTMPNNPLWSSSFAVAVLNVSNRSGIIGTIQIPILTLFALRNNLLIWCTGWSFSTFNTYHRAIGRVTFLMLLVHTVCKQLMMMSFNMPLYLILYPTMLYRLGVAALVLMSLLIFTSWFRTTMYEMFLSFHILAAFSAYILALYHMKGLGYQQAVYVSLAIWAFDWFFRICRLIFINYAIFLDPANGTSRVTHAQVQMLESDVINVKIKTPIKWTVTPGQYIFIHFNKFSLFQSHPFSVIGPSEDGESLQLLCKARGGITKKIKDYLNRTASARDGGYPEIMNVMVEGPYGHHCPVERYDTVLLVAGGIGITGIIPYAEYLIEHTPKQQHIMLIWTVAEIEEFNWIKDRLQMLARTGRVELCLFATRASKKTTSDIVHHVQTVYENKGIQTDDIYNSRTEISDVFQTKHEGNETFELEDALSSDRAQETQPVERKRNSLYKHFKSFSQGSARFQVSATQRAENIDGTEMVEWPGPIHQYHHEMNKHRSMRYQKNADANNPRFNVTPYAESQQYNNSKGNVRNTIMSLRKGSTDSIVAPHLSSYAWADFIQHGRPNLFDVIAELFMGASGSVAIVGCGPARMMDTLRQGVALHLDLVSNGRADYFEEAFTW